MSSETFFSTVRIDTKKILFFRALLLSIPGIILLLGVGIFTPVAAIQNWGLLTFFVGMGLIAWGMIPYRKLHRIRKIVCTESGISGIPYAEISRLKYVEGKTYYGIQVALKSGKRVYFPFFSESTYARLNDIVHAYKTN